MIRRIIKVIWHEIKYFKTRAWLRSRAVSWAR